MATIATTQPKVLFPAPPPTTNSLTVQQRNQLLRKTKKLEQLLGAAPHLIDNSGFPHTSSTVHVDYPSPHKRRASVSTTGSRGSFDSFSSASAASTHSSTSQLLSSLKRNSSTSSMKGSIRRSGSTLKKSISAPAPHAPHHTAPSYETWSDNRPPFLRINTHSPNDLPYWASSPAHGHSKRYTLAPSSPDSEYSDDSSTAGPSFNISCSRKSKMDRLQRKLGHGVPIELVFPSEPSRDVEDDEDDLEVSGSSGDEWLLVPPPPPRYSKASGTIAGARDSLIVQHASSRHSSPSPSSQSPSPESLGVPPSTPPSAKGRRLSAIVEGLDEPAVGAEEKEEIGTKETLSPPKAPRRRWSLRPQ